MKIVTNRTGNALTVNVEFDAHDGTKVNETLVVSGSPKSLTAFEAALTGTFPHGEPNYVPIGDDAVHNTGPQEPLARYDWLDAPVTKSVAVANTGAQQPLASLDWLDAPSSAPRAVANATVGAGAQEPLQKFDW